MLQGLLGVEEDFNLDWNILRPVHYCCIDHHLEESPALSDSSNIKILVEVQWECAVVCASSVLRSVCRSTFSSVSALNSGYSKGQAAIWKPLGLSTAVAQKNIRTQRISTKAWVTLNNAFSSKFRLEKLGRVSILIPRPFWVGLWVYPVMQTYDDKFPV